MDGMEAAGTLCFLAIFPLLAGMMLAGERGSFGRAGKWLLIVGGAMIAPLILRLFVGAIFG